MTSKRAIIVGAGGQDGTLLSAHLAGLGYELTRIRRADPVDVLDPVATADLIRKSQPAEVYYLAAFHHSSEDRPTELAELLKQSMAVNFRGFVNVLDAAARYSAQTRIFYASSSLVFGDAPHAPQTEATPIAPVEAYGISKAAGMGACRLYRRERGVFAVSGILYNHESHLRSPVFVSRKIVRAAVAASRGATAPLKLGSLDAQVDWSAAADVVRAMHAMLQADEPEDLVIASGTLHTIRDFAQAAFAGVGLDYRDHVVVDDAILQRRVAGVPRHGDPSRLLATTGYRPEISFDQMIAAMVTAELRTN